MSADIELLRLAAKAAGIDIDFDVCCIGKYGHGRTRFHAIAGWWNPLIDDGDALLLAVKLRLKIDLETSGAVFVSNFDCAVFVQESFDSDPSAVTRFAIVRAAAVIGRAMP